MRANAEEGRKMFYLKLLVTVSIIVIATKVGHKFPTLAALIVTMPLTSLIVLTWLHTDNPGNYQLLESYTKGAIWGIFPTIIFFLMANWGFHKHYPFLAVIGLCFVVWLGGAFLHQWFLR